ncbi:hypothetical protein MSBRW_2536 [Methanosarcina barkeri str. Wiesmoor]|uniref:site-specific DNA-methyltransferase (adenine-specific) n=2 Tax=Methanosarcina barkeri TaxID=2208 RepID=A0A0E3QLE6_METBA|nr:hypothetical protein MSBRW_2536 [Methanosarcina barkeri str. Wiesmoor]
MKKIIPSIKESARKIPFDEYFLNQIEKWRLILSEDLILNSPSLLQEELNYLVQKLINRIIFLRICEDRNLEKYENLKNIVSYSELKKLFLKADIKYNSGIFDFIDDEFSLKFVINDEILVNIFKELYYPNSPYSFSVVDARILGEIYEMFLAKEAHIVNKSSIEIVEKPEVIESRGIVPTPKYIVDAIIERTVKPKCEGKNPIELSQLKIADISCGSGSFLLATYEYLLNYYLEWYIQDGVEKHTNELFEHTTGTFYLRLEEKCKILLNNIFGVDIDSQAVEVTKFGLLLKTLENVNSSVVATLSTRSRTGVLPKLSKNIICGNSLVDSNYFYFEPKAKVQENIYYRVNPFDWNNEFKDVIEKGGFDVIIGNPPYVRIQNIVKYSPKEVEYYKSKYSPFVTANKDNIDKYYLFIERAKYLLNSEGILGYIVPHKFFKIKSGQELRRLISSNKNLSEIVHFGVEQVFGTKTTYTCILVLQSKELDEFKVNFVSNIDDWRNGKNVQIEKYKSNYINETPWIFLHPKLDKLFKRINSENPVKLEDITEIFVGVQTSKDKIYIFKPVSEDNYFVRFLDSSGSIQEIEKSILRPCIYDEEKIVPLSRIKPNSYIIYPYKIIDNKAIPYSHEEMMSLFPKCWDYLSNYKQDLLSRSINLPASKSKEDWFYLFGRSQSLTKFNENPKIIWPTLSLKPRYAYDENNIVFTGGGNGPYYALQPKNETKESIFYIQAILCHPIIESIVQSRGSPFKSGYISHGKQFIKKLPFRTIYFENSSDVEAHNRIVELVTHLIELNEKLLVTNVPSKKEILHRQCKEIKNEIDYIINSLYKFDADEIKLSNL